MPTADTISVFEVGGVHIGDFTLESPLLAPIPVADYFCPTGLICRVNNLGLSVMVVGSVGITPDTGALNLSGDTTQATTVPEPPTWLLMVAALVMAPALIAALYKLDELGKEDE